nr:EcsC family protein [Ornithinimicrobium cerasi]
MKVAKDVLPDWTGQAAGSAQRTLGKLSRAGLSPKRVVTKHQKKGHPVDSLRDLRRLDLEQIDEVRGRGSAWYYPAFAALSGAGAGLVISGGQLVVVASAGAGTAPAAPAVLGAVAADASVILGLSSRAVGQVALFYGYDPEDPAEKLFVMSVVNAGTAVSATAKTAAMRDISKLTQALVRGKTWAILNESIVSRVAGEFAKAFGVRLTKQGLGKLLPAVGIALGGTFNWATLEGIVDAADFAYRRRFLLDKFPELQGEAGPYRAEEEDYDAADTTISVLETLAEAGGPDLVGEVDHDDRGPSSHPTP